MQNGMNYLLDAVLQHLSSAPKDAVRSLAMIYTNSRRSIRAQDAVRLNNAVVQTRVIGSGIRQWSSGRCLSCHVPPDRSLLVAFRKPTQDDLGQHQQSDSSR